MHLQMSWKRDSGATTTGGILLTGEEEPHKSRSCLADTFSVHVSCCSPPWRKQKHLWGLFRGL